MSRQTNSERANDAAGAIRLHAGTHAIDEDDMATFLVDFRHLCDARGWSFTKINGEARARHEQSVADGGVAKR